MDEDINALWTLKARYFRYMDTKRWDRWGDLFTTDAVFYRDATGLEPFAGRDNIVTTVQNLLDGVVSVHHGHTPELTIHTPQKATGVWAMEDLLITRTGAHAGRVMHGYGHYFEEYEKVDGRWQFASIRLTRLHVTISEQPRFTAYPGGTPLAPGSSAMADFED